jgi:acyl-CoA thioester hydrolase
MAEPDAWDLPEPYVLRLRVMASEIDEYAHVNNAVYVSWFDRTAWSHSAALGVPIETCLSIDRGMAVLRSEIAYLRPAVLDDDVEVGTWLLAGNGRLRVRRRFQARRSRDGVTLARADIQYVCIELSSGRPVRWPEVFLRSYVPSAAVEAAYRSLAPV